MENEQTSDNTNIKKVRGRTAKQTLETTLMVEISNQTVQSITMASALSNEVVKMVLTNPNKTQDDITAALNQLMAIQEAGNKSVEYKMNLLKQF